MRTFNRISYASGRVQNTIKAETLQDAKNQLELKGYDGLNLKP